MPGMSDDLDELFKNAVEIVVQYDRVNASILQRRLSIGYARSARIIDQLETAGVVGPMDGSKPREVLIRSAEELFGKEGSLSQSKQENVFEVPANYKVPTDVTLSRAEKSLWGKQLSEVVGAGDFKNVETQYPILLGFDENSEINVSSLPEVNNLVVVGNPVSKKENWIDTVLVTLLLKHSPKDLRFVLIDEGHYLDFYNGIPHLFDPVITDFEKSRSAYRWALHEMNRRMTIFNQSGVRSIDTYKQLSDHEPMSRILIVAYLRYSDLETTFSLARLAAGGARAGIHLCIITNRMNDQNLSPDIKANIPSRAVFTVTTAQESKFAGVKGADNLSEGEMLYKQGNAEPKKLTTIYTPEVNVKEVVEAVKNATK
jgi:DNA segregation ATPase FtsK/SpoIIIE-like protein